ncbi:MAG: DNA polymerase I [Alloprevotella sp.]|nr:DNA polymerase I [Alloprevotella sp.]
MQKLYLLDAYALIYRAYYALIRSPRINSKGMNTSAIFGFVNTLEEILRKEQPDAIAVAFDPAGPTFRHEAYPEYKAQREATPEDIRRSVPVIKDIIRAYRIPLLEVPGYEADDVIGTVAKLAAAEGFEVRMVTPDKDYAQLVEENILMQRPGKGSTPWEVLGPREVCGKYGFQEPVQMIDYLALMGDTADNIPGCPGVGPKTAGILVGKFGTIENLLQHTDQLKGAQRQKVEENAEQIKFSKFLTRIKTDVPLPADFSVEGLRCAEADREALRQLFTQLEFRTFLARLSGEEPAAKAANASEAAPRQLSLFDFAEPEPEALVTPHSSLLSYDAAKVNYHLVGSLDEARALCRQLLPSSTLCFDTETTSADAVSARLVGMSFAVREGEAWYVPVPHDDAARAQEIVDIFLPLFQNESSLKVGQNMKYDITVLARYGVEVRGELFDTMLAHYVLQPELRHGMDYLAEIYLHYRTIHFDDLFAGKEGLRKAERCMADLTPEEVYVYACEDADVTLRLMHPLREELTAAPGLLRVFRDIEMPLVPVLSQMEQDGVLLDTAALREAEEDFIRRLQDIEDDVFRLAGHPFLINSPKQVGEVLFGELRISDKVKRTKSGQFSTSEEVLQNYRNRHPIVQKILDYRGLKKLLSTYVEALPKLINPETGHIHTSFNQAVTATGRLSSSNPNLQNIPVRGEDGKEIRKAFIPEPGSVFFSADYSQIELRIMAHLSGDPAMTEAFREGHDIHAATAARIFHKPIDDVSRDERRIAKTANFGILYGISAFGLATRMDVSRTEARQLIDDYFATYPHIREFITASVDAARRQGYIETAFGRRRYLPDINSHNATVRGYAERNAVNAPIQGTAADIIKIAMVRIHRRMKQAGLQAKMILQVHDELNFSVPPQELPVLRSLVIEEMQGAYAMSVPLLADCGEGTNWLEAH